MPAAFRFLDTDETTIITSSNEGNVATPGTSTAHKVFVENFGDQDAEDTAVALTTVGTNDGVSYGQLALDSGGSPSTFGSTPLSLGTLTPGTTVPFWVRVSVPAGRTADNNPRRFDVVATALTI